MLEAKYSLKYLVFYVYIYIIPTNNKVPAIFLSLPILYVAKVLNMNSVLRLYPCGRHDILAEMFKARKYPATKGSAGDEEGSA